MTRFLQAAKDVIVAASANPLALAALLLLLVTWLVVALKVNRNKELLKNLNKLPNRDRLKALQAEMGVVQIKGGLSPEQWLRNKVRTYYLVALAMLCVTVIVLIAIIVNSHAAALKSGASVTLNTPREDLLTSSSRSVSPKPPSPVSPERPPSPKTYRPLRQTSGTTIPSILRAVQVTNTDSPRLAGEWDIPPERTVTYASDLRDGLPEIRFRLPYHDMLARGGPVSGMNYMDAPFRWRYPELSVNVVNNTAQNMVLSQAVVTILSSHVELEPMLLFEDLSVNKLIIRNEGWGQVINPVVNFSVSEARDTGEVSLFSEQQNVLKIESFETVKEIPLLIYVPARLQHESLVSVSGTVSYGEPDTRKSLQFTTRVSLQVRAGAGMTASRCYDARFEAGVAPVRLLVGLAQQIKPGDADNFLIRLATNKTSTNRARIEFLTAGGETLPGGEFQVEIFVPRSGKAELCGR